MYQVPILVIGFNRPDLLLDLFNRLRDLQPSRLLVAIDGPRDGVQGDIEMVDECKATILQIDWPCSVDTLFRKSNLGCGKAVSSAIEWAFTLHDELVILEDDIVPNLNFFHFCSRGLEAYRSNQDVMSIGGYNSTSIQSCDGDTFSSYPEIWGWATWKAKWSTYSFEISDITLTDIIAIIRANNFNLLASLLWLIRFRKVKAKKIDTWDYQFVFASFTNNKLHLISPDNQIKNVGFDARATHTIFKPKIEPHLSDRPSAVIGYGSHNKTHDNKLRKQEFRQFLHSIIEYLSNFMATK